MPHTIEQPDAYNDDDDALAELTLLRRPGAASSIELKADKAAAGASAAPAATAAAARGTKTAA